MYNVKNYTEQGGEKTVIGGVLEIKEGASITGLPLIDNQADSTASTVAGLKEDFNSLLRKLKDSGYMATDAWNITVSKIAQTPSADPNAESITANQSEVSTVTIADNVITVTADVSELLSFPSSVLVQGTHKWVGIEITTGLLDITAIKYNGYQLTADDVADTTSCGGSAGDVIMWLKCDELVTTPKTFTLWTSGYAVTEFTLVVAAPEE